MDKIFIKERINILDYKNNNQELVYSSQQDIDGGLLNIQLESDVAGWHELTFDIPAFIVREGKQIPNPLLEHLFPLAKLQYTKTIKVDNKEEELILYFVIQPEDGIRDNNGIVTYSYTAIDQPRHYLSKSKNGLTIGENTIDAKRSLTPNNEIMDVPGKITYVKAPVQQFSVATKKLLLDLIDALPGAFAYVTETKKYYRLIELDYAKTDESGNPINWLELANQETYTITYDSITGKEIITPAAIWNPDWLGYPLAPDVNNYNYGTNEPTKVQFYWDTWFPSSDRTMGRFDGVMYKKGDRLLYDVYETLNYEFPDTFLGTIYTVDNLKHASNPYEEGATAYVVETGTVWIYLSEIWQDTFQNKREAFKTELIYKGDWAKLSTLKAYLAPNVPKAYLEYILEGTDWKVGVVDEIKVQDGKIEKDPENSTVSPVLVDKTAAVYFDNSNAYNAIGEIAEAFQMYPRFDHVNKTVSLKSIPGEDNNLIFQWRDNLQNTKITKDGEKTVSKLWVYGGEDIVGQVTIADYERIEPAKYKGAYATLIELKAVYPGPSNLEKDDYARLVEKYTWKELVNLTYNNGQRLPIAGTFVAGQLTVTSWGTGQIPVVQSLVDLPGSGKLGQAVYVLDMDSIFAWIPTGNAWYDTHYQSEPTDSDIEISVETLVTWNSNAWITKGQYYEYYEPVSPFGDNYILDFNYFLDRDLITSEEVEDIKYNYVLPISRLNRKRWPLVKQLINYNQELLDRNAQYDAAKIAKDAVDKTLRTRYSIYDLGTQPATLLELEVNAYPPGATINTKGWIPAAIVYSDSNAPEYATYSAVPSSGTLGQFIKVRDEAQVYVWSAPFSYKDTITSYLGWEESQIANTTASAAKKNKEYLHSPGTALIEARIRTAGLFQTYRDDELNTRTGLGPWFNPPANMHMVPVGDAGDPTVSTLGNNYYSALQRKVDEQLNMEDCLDRIAALESNIINVEEKLELLQKQIDTLEHGLRIKYGDYIVEGMYTNEDMVYVYNLWQEGLKALQLYHYPLVTYELGVVDVSGLPEYRTMTKEIYHDIVYRLNKPELVLPNPGDYVYVTDNTLGLVRVQANITSVIRNLSNPSQHQITIATVDTNTEDLIGKLITAANTIFDKQTIYNRSAIIQSDGTIATDSVKNTIDDPDADITVLGRNGTVRLEGNGIITVDRDDPYQKMQYTGKGIYASTDNGTTWENIISAGKIQIKSLSAGSIDTNTISVASLGHNAGLVFNGRGIAAYNYTGAINNPSAPTDSKLSFFLNAETGDAYFKGNINAGSGLIGGWTIATSGLTSRGSDTSGYTTFTGMSSTSTDYRFVAGGNTYSSAKFAVKPDGTMKATAATIEGAITGGSINIGNNFIVTSDGTMTMKKGSINIANQFIVDTAGNMTANNGTFKGNISASNISGSTITSTAINSNTITGGTISGTSITGGTLNIGSGRFTVNSSGYMSCTGATFTNGTITGAAIDIAQKFKINSSLSGPELTNTRGGFITMGNPNAINGWHSGVNIYYRNGVALHTGDSVNGSLGTKMGSLSYNDSNDLVLETLQNSLNISSTNGGIKIKSKYIIFEQTESGGGTGMTKDVTYQTSLTDRRVMVFKNGILINERGN